MSRVRVLFLVDSLARGGTERNISVLSRHIDVDRYAPSLWVLRPRHSPGEEIEVDRISVRWLNRRPRNPLHWVRTASEIAASGFGLVQAFSPSSAICAGLGSLVQGCPPVVVSVATTRLPPGSRIKPSLYRWVLRRSPAITANSESVCRFLRSLGVPEARVSLVPNGHEEIPLLGSAEVGALKAELGIGSADTVIGYTGRLIASKRVEDLVRAMDLLRERRNLKALIVGWGPARAKLEREVRRLRLGQQVHFLGLRRDVGRLLQVCDLFVFPSEFEGLPNSVIEAGMVGLPVVACDVDGVRDVVRNRREALLVPPRSPNALATAIQEVLDDQALAEALGQAASARAATFSIESSLDCLYRVYSSVLT